MSLLVPDNITEATGTYVTPEQAAQDSVVATEFRKLLKSVDPRLDIVFVPPLPPDEPTPWPKSGRFYIIRRNPLTNDSFWMVEDAEGNYSAPTMAHFRALQARDTHAHPDVWKQISRANDKRIKDAESRMEAKRAEFREKLLERFDFNDRSFMAVSGEMKAKLARSGQDA